MHVGRSDVLENCDEGFRKVHANSVAKFLNFGHQRSLPRLRFVGSAAHADALKPGVSGFVRHHLFVHKGRKSQRSTRHYLNQRPWARQDTEFCSQKI